MTRAILCRIIRTSPPGAWLCHRLSEVCQSPKGQLANPVLALTVCAGQTIHHHFQANIKSRELVMSSTGLFSPAKQALQTALLPSKHASYSPSKQPSVPCTACASHHSVSPQSARRCLSALQTHSSSGPLLPGRQALWASTPVCKHNNGHTSSMATGLAVSSPPSQTSPAVAPSTCSGAASASSTVAQALQQQQHKQQLALSCSIDRSHAKPGQADLRATDSVAPLQAASVSIEALTSAVSGRAYQLPSPTVILDSPPELVRVDSFGRQQQAAQALQDTSLRPAMSGFRVTKRFDVPLDLDWLDHIPDHVAALGSGRLDVIMGPMFAGKTTQLIKRVHELSGNGHIAVVVKSSKDARYGCHWIVTHDGRCMRCFTADTLQDFKKIMGLHYQKLQVLAIDEAQFFPDLSEFCRHAVDHEGKHVIVAGLSGDSNRQRFGQLLDLMPLADDVMKLTSKCAFCDQTALFSVRLVASAPQALVGGDDKYRAACRRCYLTHAHYHAVKDQGQ